MAQSNAATACAVTDWKLRRSNRALRALGHSGPAIEFSAPGPLSHMLKTLSLSVMFFLSLGLLFAAYASVPVPL
jgi:hypothetical protein